MIECLRTEAASTAARVTATASEMAEGAVANEVLRLSLTDSQKALREGSRELSSCRSDRDRAVREKGVFADRLKHAELSADELHAAVAALKARGASAEEASGADMSRLVHEHTSLQRELEHTSSAARGHASVLETERDAARSALYSEKERRAKLESLLEGRLGEVNESRNVITNKVSGLEETLSDLTTRLQRTTRERDEAINREIKACTICPRSCVPAAQAQPWSTPLLRP